MAGFLTSFRFLAGAIAGLLGSEAIEDALTPKDKTPQQSNITRLVYGIAIGVVVALLLDYLKKKKIL